jgi:CRP/FNR family cyclic AMP-dependent transcriptional regulator
MASARVSAPLVDCLISQLDAEGFVCSLPSRSILFMEGDLPRGIHILAKGHVKLTVSSREGRVLIVKIADPGEILGLHNCISGLPYELTAQTLQPCHVSFVKREDLIRVLRNSPEACLIATQRLSRTCHTAFSQVGSIQFSHSASEKLARFLLTISGDAPEPNCSDKLGNGTAHVEMDLTHDEIAQAIGASRETVTRALASFRKKQLANLTRSMLMVKNRAELEKIAGMGPEPTEPLQDQGRTEKRNPLPAHRPVSARWSATQGNSRAS